MTNYIDYKGNNEREALERNLFAYAHKSRGVSLFVEEGTNTIKVGNPTFASATVCVTDFNSDVEIRVNGERKGHYKLLSVIEDAGVWRGPKLVKGREFNLSRPYPDSPRWYRRALLAGQAWVDSLPRASFR